MEVLSIGRKDLIDLERCFFEEIDYNTMISNYDYHFVLAKLLGMEPETESKDKIKDAWQMILYNSRFHL